jgi:predicted RNA binding protein YcfA (HicA-like mRNA interferase family)
MGIRRYPPLTPQEVIAILIALGFHFKRQIGSHAHYERVDSASRHIVTVDTSVRDFAKDLIKSMIAQSGEDRKMFYRATRKTAKKI